MPRFRRFAYVGLLVIAGLALLAGVWRVYGAATMVRSDVRGEAPSYGGLGPRGVGTRKAVVHAGGSLPVTLWYPAPDDGRGEVRSSYAYPLKWFVRLDRVARVAGRARWNAPFDRSLGPRPLVVLSPGFTVPGSGYAWLAERLASHGFVVVALEHDEVMTERLEAFWRAAVTRPRDVRAAVDWVAEEAADGLGILGRSSISSNGCWIELKAPNEAEACWRSSLSWRSLTRRAVLSRGRWSRFLALC